MGDWEAGSPLRARGIGGRTPSSPLAHTCGCMCEPPDGYSMCGPSRPQTRSRGARVLRRTCRRTGAKPSSSSSSSSFSMKPCAIGFYSWKAWLVGDPPEMCVRQYRPEVRRGCPRPRAGSCLTKLGFGRNSSPPAAYVAEPNDWVHSQPLPSPARHQLGTSRRQMVLVVPNLAHFRDVWGPSFGLRAHVFALPRSTLRIGESRG